MPFPEPQFDPNPNRECPEDRDRKCNADLDDRSAAILYAGIAVQIHDEAKRIARSLRVSSDERFNARFTIAFTRVYSQMTNRCVGIGTSSDLYGYMSRRTSNGTGPLWSDIINQALTTSPHVQITLRQSTAPLRLHAEEKIDRYVKNSVDFTGYRAIGISNSSGPCHNCQTIVNPSSNTPRIGYIDGGIPRTFPP